MYSNSDLLIFILLNQRTGKIKPAQLYERPLVC